MLGSIGKGFVVDTIIEGGYVKLEDLSSECIIIDNEWQYHVIEDV